MEVFSNVTTRVKCTVDTCHYWGQGEVCQADEISVNHNHAGAGMGATRTAFTNSSDLSASGHSPARTSSETMCQTYRPRSGGATTGTSGATTTSSTSHTHSHH